MNLCPGCGNAFRKGRRRMVLMASGELVSRLVCAPCAVGRAVGIVPCIRANPCANCGHRTKNTASTCGDCLNAAVHSAVTKTLAPFAAELYRLAKVCRLDSHPDAPGLERAADFLAASACRIHPQLPEVDDADQEHDA